MKTQINNLVNGSKSVVGRVEDYKGGSNYNVRTEIATKVQTENEKTLTIEVNGISLTLNRTQSFSGKTVTFVCNITAEQYKNILGFSSDINSYEASYTFTINSDMTCQIDKFARKNDTSQWKHRGYTFVSESMITIK